MLKNKLLITPIPAFADNYIWLLRTDGRDCAVVDPGDADPVIEQLRENGLNLRAILITHKHHDHTGGIAALKKQWPSVRVYGPAKEAIAQLDECLREGDQVILPGMGSCLEVLDIPGHTEGHIGYYGEGALFCGDTLFAAGCGRVFSGTFSQLSDSLRKISRLPPATRIYCAHEYTLDNIGFAKWVEPENPALKERERVDRELREFGRPTVPSTLELELATNPFLRVKQPSVIAQAQKRAGKACRARRDVFRVIRKWKDTEYD